MNVTLSILIVTHNQLTLLKRCLRSVLAQKINVPYEIVVSDDMSQDGTFEYMSFVSRHYSVYKITNLVNFVYTRCNSDDCDPSNVSERCGWNKLNAYKHAVGQFFVNIDADDYLRSNDIYQCQLDMLNKNPECSMCMQDVWQVNNGDTLNNGLRWPSFDNLNNGQIITVKDVITKFRALNQCYMIRRHFEFDMAYHYGKFFDDTVITLHHLQYGPCVWIDRADYVWVKYKNSITSSLTGDDELVIYSLLPFHHIRFIPKFAGLFMQDAIPILVRFYKTLCKKSFALDLTERSLSECRRNKGFIYERLLNGFSIFDKIKLYFIRCLLLFLNKNNITSQRLYKYLFILNIGRHADCLHMCKWTTL